ncbi:MAG: transcriptional regulator [Propioniciclava sp.]|uniref:transcriptional regulator n=1 Tax=Propioniciclava sp. TaxID=2038686 RepID=UPI0039E59173
MKVRGKAQFDPVIHSPHRLRICAALDSVDEAEFELLREVTGVSESVLSKQVKTLEEAGYVTTTKATRASRVRTWASITNRGKAAYQGHVMALQEIVSGL